MADVKVLNLEALNALQSERDQQVARGVSATASAQTVTQAAPGAGNKLHVSGLVAYYSDGSDNELTINYTDPGGTPVTFTVNTGAQLILRGLSIETDLNTQVSVDAPAGAAGVTSTVQLITWTEEE